MLLNTIGVLALIAGFILLRAVDQENEAVALYGKPENRWLTIGAFWGGIIGVGTGVMLICVAIWGA